MSAAVASLGSDGPIGWARSPRRRAAGSDPAIPLLSWRGVRYSVPARALGQTVEVHHPVDSEVLTIQWAGQTIATHTRAPAGSGDVLDPAHHADAVHAALNTATGRHLHPVRQQPVPAEPAPQPPDSSSTTPTTSRPRI